LPHLKTRWQVHFTPQVNSGSTIIREVMHMPLGKIGQAALALISKHPAKEVSANLHRRELSARVHMRWIQQKH
jgi:hypothetical protein